MSIEVNAQRVIDNLLEQNKQLTLEIAILRAQLEPEPQSQDQPTEQ